MQVTTVQARAPIRVMLMYRDPLFHAGLVTTICGEERFEAVHACGRGRDDDVDLAGDLHAEGGTHRVVEAARHLQVDVVVTDYECAMRLGREGLVTHSGAVRSSRNGQACREPKLMIVTWRCGEDEIRAALSGGVQGYLPMWCAVPELIEGIVAVHEGRRYLGPQIAQRLAEGVMHDSLTGRESDVLQLVAQGLSNKSVARELDIAVATVKAHVKSIFAKLGAASRTQASALAQRRGLINRLSVGHSPPHLSTRT